MSITRVGRYEIEKELGRGAMAVVYRAVDPVIGRVVAIKTIRLESALAMEQVELRQRLYREAQSAGGLNHPNIVTIYDIGEEGDLSYIAMEYVEGETLEHWMATHPIPPIEQTVSIIEQVASGLDYAAQRGVTHRDIKPGNILVTTDLRAKIADFGIAKLSMSKFTQTGAIMGTPSYMSPEQAMGKDLDGRSDIFSAGVIFYEMLTGERPFSGTNPTTIIYKILHEEPVPPRKLNITLHPGYDRIVQRMLAKDPAQRFQTCGEVVQALKNYPSFGVAEEGRKKTEEVQPPRKRSHWVAVQAAVAVVIVAALSIFLYQQKQRGAQSAEVKPAVASNPALPAPAPPKPESPPPSPSDAAPKTPPPPVTEEVVPKQPQPPPPERVLPAKVQLAYAGAEYPAALFDGSRKLETVGLSVEVPPGEHRFRIISEEVYLEQELDRIRLKPAQAYSINFPGLGSAYIEVPNDAYDGCEILLNGRKLPTPYPALIQKIAAGNHQLVFRWASGKYSGKDLPFLLSIGEKHHYLVKGDPQTGQVTVQQAR